MKNNILSYQEFLENETYYGEKVRGHALSTDQKLKKYLNYSNGVYIESGASAGIAGSNTKIFEDFFGWTGLLIEPCVEGYDLCLKNRPNSISVHAALVSNDFKDDEVYGDFAGSPSAYCSVGGWKWKKMMKNDPYLLSREMTNVPATTITSILENNNITDVDFWSLDTEGYELEALKGLDFSKWQPKYILVELLKFSDHPKTQWNVKDPSECNFEEVKSYLLKIGYKEPINLTEYTHDSHDQWDGLRNDWLFEWSKNES